MERELEAIRRSWLDGIAKVIEAPAGSVFAVLPPQAQPVGPSGMLPVRLTNDPNAPPYYAASVDETHPYRQKEAIREINAKLAGRKMINSHDIQCIRRVYNIEKDISLCYTQKYAPPRYSAAFVDWIAQRYAEDAELFEKARAQVDKPKADGV